MLPLLKAETVDKRHWLTEEELLDYFSIGQCTPGIIAINVSTFCGYKVAGIRGAVAATFAMVLPSLIIITLIASVLSRFMDTPWVLSAFSGIRLGVTALLVNLLIEMSQKLYHDSKQKILHFAVFVAALILLIFCNVSAVWIVILAACFGFAAAHLKRNRS
jgi:chromate transporter